MSISVEKVSELADLLGTPFVERDWDYTRDEGGLKHLRYDYDYTGYNRVHRRFWRAVKHNFLPPPRNGWEKALRGKETLKGRFIGFWVFFAKDKNLPDGVLNGGSIITFWEETGEYIQYMQPSVGGLLADFLRAEPEHPHAQRIATELKRINDRYTERTGT